MKLLIALIVSVSALPGAQESIAQATVVRAVGDATAYLQADQSRLRLGIVTEAGTADHAREKNAERATAVIARCKELLGQDAGIKTISYSLTKSYAGGFVASNIIEVPATDPKVIGKLIDAATKAGATVVGGLESSALDEQQARSEALKQATLRAQQNADVIAAALGMHAVRVVSVETSNAPVIPVRPVSSPVAAKRAGGIPTPIASGTIEVRAQVTIAVEAAR